MPETLREYIQSNFNISMAHLSTLEAIYEYMDRNCHSLETAHTYGYCLVPLFWHDFMNVCDAGGVDITEKEIIDCVPENAKEV